MNDTAARTRWGKVRFAGGGIPAMAFAIPGGVVLAAVLGAVAGALGFGAPRPVLGGVILGVCTVPVFVALVWVIVVDRSTLTGATERPEESVESAWLDTAALGALTDTVVAVGLTLVVLTIFRIDLDARIALVGVLVVAGGSGTIRFLLAKSRG